MPIALHNVRQQMSDRYQAQTQRQQVVAGNAKETGNKINSIILRGGCIHLLLPYYTMRRKQEIEYERAQEAVGGSLRG